MPNTDTVQESVSERTALLHEATEQHSDSADVVRDIVIGFSDGITVPFALTAGLSSLGSSKVVIVGGLAELFSGSISMGLGAYLAAVTDLDHYKSEEEREREEVTLKPAAEMQEIHDILARYGISREASQGVLNCLTQDREQWIRFMMDFELKLEKPNVSRARISGLTMGISYFIGGLFPLIPYFAIQNTRDALFVSIGVTIVILLIFGYIKNYVVMKTKRGGVYGAIEALLVGALAASTSYGIVFGIERS